MSTESIITLTGLTSAEVTARRARFGDNTLPEEVTESVAKKLLAQFQNPLIYILLFALLVDSGLWWYDGTDTLPVESAAILLILLTNAGLGLWQDLKSEAALAKLKKYAEPHCWVIRDGALRQVESRALVPGDMVRVEAGERLPADGRVVKNSALIVDESIVTGESLPVTMEIGSPVLSGTLAVRGTALIQVTTTGINSNMGKLAVLLAGVERDKTPLEKRLQQVGRRIAVAVSIAAVLLWTLGVLLTGTSHIGELFLFAVALAVAAVPESLPAVITLTLAMGIERMARRKAVVRKMSAVEALGSVTVIASDKTGTLTENRMTVQELDCLDIDATHRAMVLVNDAELEAGAGDPLELAMLTYVQAQDAALINTLRDRCQPVSSRPFDAEWKYMRASVSEANGAIVSYFKGAPEVLLGMSTLDNTAQAQWRERIEGYAGKGYRAIAVARSGGETETGLEWLGLILLLDPPRPEVAEAIRLAQAAGIRVLMITGDHPATGFEIARQVGILSRGVFTGAELEQLSPRAFGAAIADCNVFARISPELKYRIIKSLQDQGQVVAVTGDGVNDAPALKAADVGVAMGQRGSDVAREVADLVLVDDNFATIVSAIEEGRNIFENIQKFLRFLFAANLAEVLLIVIGSLVTFTAVSGDTGFLLPLTAAQILWINLLTDSIPALAITLDRNPGVLNLKPRLKTAALLDRNTLSFILAIGLLGSLVSLALLYLLPQLGVAPELTQTVVFCYLTVVQFAVVNPARQSNLMPERNPLVALALLVSVGLQVLVVSVPALRALLGLAPLNWPMVGLLVVLLGVSWVLAALGSSVLRRRALY